MLVFKQTGDLKKTYQFLKRVSKKWYLSILNKYGELGVSALEKTTPKKTGKTAESWEYKIIQSNGNIKLSFNNSNVNEGVPIAIVIQYGHVTPSGSYIEGIDYINPALKPVFNKLAEDLFKEVGI